jgi:hypothetical protein
MRMPNAFPLRTHDGDLWRGAKINKQRPSEGELADRLAERHSGEIRYATWKRKWISWNGEEWLLDKQNLALHLAREICKEAAEAYGDRALDSHRSVAGVVALAKCDPRLVADSWPCHPEIEGAVAEWIEGRVSLDPEGWVSSCELLKSFPNWQRFDPDDLSAAWAAHGITFARKRNKLGFSGVKLKLREAGDGDA